MSMLRKNGINIMIIVVLVLTTNNTIAQGSRCQHEIGGSIFAPAIASLSYHGPVAWKNEVGVNWGIGANYTYWINNNIGVSTSLKFTLSNSSHITNDAEALFNSTVPIDGYGNTNVTVRSTIGTVSESQTTSMLEIPICFAWHYQSLYINTGFAFMACLSNYANYTYEHSEYAVIAVPDMGITTPFPIPVDLPERGMSPQGMNDRNLPLFCLLAIDANYRFFNYGNNTFSVGIYGRYALNTYKYNAKSPIYMMSSEMVTSNLPSTTDLVERVGYYEIGLRLSYNYGIWK